ncbi:MAG: class I SAM-dependent methyltransferase [Planctomycetes bacterium]|nr:class I SAM-dependent methyltransferase [Planctomycetota bacterium]
MSTDLTPFEGLDVYLFDQLVKGRIHPGMRVLDAGCGGGRNARWLVEQGAEVHGVDRNPEALERAAEHLGLGPERLQVADLEALPFEAAAFDAVLCCAVLHFAADHGAFERMLDELVRVLRPGGVLFARLATRTGIEELVRDLGRGRYALPEDREWYLVSEDELLRHGERHGLELLEPVKATRVQGLRAMGTWVVRKRLS